MDLIELQTRFEFAKDVAISGGKLTIDLFQNPELDFEMKKDDSPVTVADRQTETHIRKRVLEKFPYDSVIGEELGIADGNSDFKWVIDPIDGTKSFIAGVPLFGTMVGVLHKDNPVIGAIYFPALDEGIYGLVGSKTVFGPGSATIDQMKIASAADRSDLSKVIFVTSEAKTFDERGAHEVYASLEKSCYVTRTWGDCYGYYLVATGRAHLMIDPKLKIWDAAAVQPILVGAGGVFCDWSGVDSIHAGEAIGMVPGISENVLEITRRFAGTFVP